MVVLRDNGGTDNEGLDASPPQTFVINITKPHLWHNALVSEDVTHDGSIAAGDVLAVVNYINAFGAGPIELFRGDGNFYDVNGDDHVSSNDALRIINHINAFGSGTPGPDGEGEAAAGVFFEKFQPSKSSTAQQSLDADLAAVLNDPALSLRRRHRR
jgi:hypothetical protein